MNKRSTTVHAMAAGIGIALAPCAPQAADWTFNASPSVTQGGYKGSNLRDTLSERGLRVSGDYLEQGGFTAGYGTTRIGMKNGVVATDQKNYLLSGRLHFTPDAIPGRLTLRVDAHRLDNNDATRNTDSVNVIAPQLSWLSRDESVYADLGYARSGYQNQLSVRQYTPTIGLGFNGGADWIQVRSYMVRGLNPARAAGKSSTNGLDTKWTHFFASQSSWVPASLTLGVITGERIYGVDMDAQSVANLADLGKGGLSLGLSWKLAKNLKLYALAGQSRFRDVALSNDYKLNVGYLNVAVDW